MRKDMKGERGQF